MKAARPERISPIGIDVDSSEIRAVQLTRVSGSWGIRCAAVLPRASASTDDSKLGSEELKEIATVLERRGFTGNQLSMNAPSGACSFHILDLPPADSGAPIDQLARAEILRGRDESFPLQIATWGHHDSYRERVRFVVSTSESVISDLAQQCEDAGFDLLRVVPSELALFRTLDTQGGSGTDEIHAIVSIGWNETLLTLTTGKTPVYSRRLPIGVSGCADAGALQSLSHGASTSLSSAAFSGAMGSIAQQLDTSLSYVSQTYRAAPFGSIWCSGYLADQQGFVDELSDRVGMQARCVDTARTLGLRGGDDAIEFYERRLESRLNTACGLAMGDAA